MKKLKQNQRTRRHEQGLRYLFPKEFPTDISGTAKRYQKRIDEFEQSFELKDFISLLSKKYFPHLSRRLAVSEMPE